MSIENFSQLNASEGEKNKDKSRSKCSISHLIYESFNGGEDECITDKFKSIWEKALNEETIKAKLTELANKNNSGDNVGAALNIEDSLFVFLLQKKVKQKFEEQKKQKNRVETMYADEISKESDLVESSHKINEMLRTTFEGATEDSFYNNMQNIIMSLEEVKTEHSLFMAGMKDETTKLWNRAALKHYVKVMEDQKDSIEPVLGYAYIIIDLDHFKKYNDKYGHDGGDEVLSSIGQALTEGNILRADDFAFRFGGEEFGIVLPIRKTDEVNNLTEEENKTKIQNRLQQVLEKVNKYVNANIDRERISEKITFSAGIRIGPANEMRQMQLQADDLLYKAKEGGRNRSALSWNSGKEIIEMNEIAMDQDEIEILQASQTQMVK